MKRALAFVYVLGVFFLGGTIGALTMHIYHAETAREIRPFGGVARPGAGGGHVGGPAGGMSRAFRLLDGRYRLDFLELTPEQKTNISGILADARKETDTLRRELRPKMEKHIRETRARIDAVLTDEQRLKLDESLERESPPGRRRGRRPPPG